METRELIRITLWADMKGISEMETLKYSDEMYGRESQTEDVWEYVVEMGEIGSIAFRDKYKEFI